MYNYQAKNPVQEATWETKVNPTLFQQMEMGNLKITQIEKEPFREQEKNRMKKAAGLGY